MMQKNNKVVLAFSGGLDTSYCVKYLKLEKGLSVHAAIVNTGGFSDEELKETAERARLLGADEFVVLEETENFYQQCLKYLIFGNILRNNTYPLSVSAERVFQALALATYARKENAAYIAHGSTGAGNDQVRFDLVFQIMAPEIEILTPIRDQKLSRKAEIDYLAKHGVQQDWQKAKYSINKGLWGTSVGGDETLTSHLALPDDAFPTPLKNKEPQRLKIHFNKGELCGLNDQTLSPVDTIRQLEHIAQPYAIGRDIHVGDTILGIKGRVGFEAAASLITIKAHHALEKHVLGKWQQYWKDQLANWYGMMVHEGQFLDPVMRNIESFLQDSQTNVEGTVFVDLAPYRFGIAGIASKYDLMQSSFGQYGEMNNAWTGEDVKGFTKILANQTKIFQHVKNANHD